MKYYMRDYRTDTSLAVDDSLYACSILLMNGDEVFAFVREVEPDIFYLQDPLLVIKSQDERQNPMIFFKKMNYFSDEFNAVLHGRSILTMNYLSEHFLDSYKNAADSIRKRTLSIQSPDQILNESDSDHEDQFFSDLKAPKILN